MKTAFPREKRKYPRIEAKIRVTFPTVEELIQEYTRNISSGGIFLKTDQPLDPNATIDLTIQFPEGLGVYTVQGRVARLMVMTHPDDPGRQLFGAGIRFLAPSSELVAAIDKLAARSGRKKAKTS
jgi:uncharacterized protein (TIGR02266 family)